MTALHRLALFGVLAIAAALRFVGLSDQSMWLDEVWAVEAADGHGSGHEAVPVGRLIADPPVLTGRAAAGPVRRVWTGLGHITHPPGWYLLLRAWMAVFGETDGAVRSLSAVCSTAAVGMTFAAVRPWAGRGPGVWAAAVTAVAGPQVHAARDGRPYALLTLWAVVTLWWVGRVVTAGPTRRRTAVLGGLLLAGLFTHYFAAGAVVAVAIYGLGWTGGATRRSLLVAPAAAVAGFALVWGPMLWRQRAAFSPVDRGVVFLHEPGPDHLRQTGWRTLTLPASTLADRRPIPWWYGLVGPAIYGLLAWRVVRRPGRWPAVWPLWCLGTVGMLLAMDVGRATAHLKFLRYAVVASPVVYAGVATAAVRPWAAAAVVVLAGWSLPAVYAEPTDDFRGLAETVRRAVGPGDVIVFAGPAATASPQVRYLMTSYYVRPPGPVLLLEHPADAAVMAELRGRPTLWLVADPEATPARLWLPGYHPTLGQGWPVVGSLWRMERDPK